MTLTKNEKEKKIEKKKQVTRQQAWSSQCKAILLKHHEIILTKSA